MQIEIPAYKDAVETLMPLAEDDYESAALVLLSAYNSKNFQLPIASLQGLDQANFEAALAVIFWRWKRNTAPHKVIENGAERFVELAKMWAED